MGDTLNIFLAILLLSIANGGSAAPCSVSDIAVNQVRTGSMFKENPEFEVTVSNKCNCAQSEVFVSCYGFVSVWPVDPRAIKRVDAYRCIINQGNPIPGGASVKFIYAWKTPRGFPVVSSQVLC